MNAKVISPFDAAAKKVIKKSLEFSRTLCNELPKWTGSRFKRTFGVLKSKELLFSSMSAIPATFLITTPGPAPFLEISAAPFLEIGAAPMAETN